MRHAGNRSISRHFVSGTYDREGRWTILENDDAGFAERMLRIRRQRGMTLEELAKGSGLTKSFLSKIERKLAVPSITTALKVSRALGVRVAELLGEVSGREEILVVRRGEGRRFIIGDGSVQNTHEALAAGRAVKKMEPFLLRPAHEYSTGVYDSDAIFSVKGEHFCYVTSGLIDIDFPEQTIRLAEGDSIYFDSSIPHRTRSAGPELGEILVIVAPSDAD